MNHFRLHVSRIDACGACLVTRLHRLIACTCLGAVIAASAAGCAQDVRDYVRPREVQVPPLAPVDWASLPRDDAGVVTIAQSDMDALQVLPSEIGPPQVFARCVALVTECFLPEVRSLDACMISVPRCATDTPYAEAPCCPAACVNGYEERRHAGTAPLKAFDEVMFRAASCVPHFDSSGEL